MQAGHRDRRQGRCPPPAHPASTDAKSRVVGTALSGTKVRARTGACAMGLSGGAGGWRDGAPLERERSDSRLSETRRAAHGGETFSCVRGYDGVQGWKTL